MKKLLLGVCAISLLNSVLVMPVMAEYNNAQNRSQITIDKATQNAMQSSDNLPKSQAGATPVSKTANGADYSSDAGNKAAAVDLGLSAISAFGALMGALFSLGLTTNHLKQWGWAWPFSQAISIPSPLPQHWEGVWTGLGMTIDIGSTFSQLGHAAVNKFMRDSTNITASFSGVQGHVTDKWIGPADRNLIVAVMDKLSLDSTRFKAVAFDKEMYANLKNATHASPRELMEYRNKELLEDQRSLQNVAKEQRGIRYRAQQRSIKALASAMELKQQLAVLGDLDAKIEAQYGSKNQALNTLAARRALYDSLMLLKMNVLAVRTKTRAETLELDFKPVKKEFDNDENGNAANGNAANNNNENGNASNNNDENGNASNDNDGSAGGGQ